MHEHKHNQCRRKVKHRKNVMKLIIFCITVGIVFLYAYYQNLRKEIDARQKWLETEKKAVGRYLDWHTGILLETDGKMGLCCFDPDLLEERLKRSDRDIIEQGLAKGVYIEDAEEYLAKLGR